MLMLACESLDRMRRAQAIICEHGEVVPTSDGSLKSNPACNIERDARVAMMQALHRLNLDVVPSSGQVGRPPNVVAWRG